MSTQINLDTQIKGSKWPSYTATDSGAVNAYAVTGIPLSPTLRGGSVIIFKAANTNTGASTLAVNGGSVIAIKKLGGSALSAGDIVANSIVTLVYDSVSSTFLYLTPATFAASQVSGVLPIANGGTGQSSFTAGILRSSGSALSAAELSGDVSTSGSNAATLASTAVSPGSYTSANITVDAKGRLTSASNGSGSGSGGSGSYYDVPSNLPDFSTFTWVNQGTATMTQNNANGPGLLHIPDNSSLNWRLLMQSAPSTPYKLKVLLRGATNGLANSQTLGIYFRDSSGGNIIAIETLLQGSGWETRVERINSVTSDNSTVAQIGTVNTANNYAPIMSPFWYQIRNDGSTLFFDWSFDGANFTNLYSEAVGAFVTPNTIGVGGVSITSNVGQFVNNDVMGYATFANATL